jgi:hypothetical protein
MLPVCWQEQATENWEVLLAERSDVSSIQEMTTSKIKLQDGATAELLENAHDCQPVMGLTHDFYRYPARFSPFFARAVIKAFTKPGDIVLDPFMGSGTTLVEARVLGRRAIGVDISELATFIARVKTTSLSGKDLSTLHRWAGSLGEKLNLRNPPRRAEEWIRNGYQRNISSRNTWPIRKTLELALACVDELPCRRQQRFARCVILKTSQWALDCREKIPSAHEVRKQLLANLAKMSKGSQEFSTHARETDRLYNLYGSFRTLCLHRSAIGMDKDPKIIRNSPPQLILTSPPYPGVHVLYHRWQVQGRKETPAPFWIANCLDGQGEGFYTFGNRKQRDLTNYYRQIHDAYASLAQIADHRTFVVQMVAFSDPSWQLPQYLQVMKQVGFTEVKFPVFADFSDGRLWRCVPNRKWYANQKGAIASSKEVVLFHRLA